MTDPVAQATDTRALEEGIYIDGELDAADLRSMLFRIHDDAPVYVDGRRCLFAYTYNGKLFLDSTSEPATEGPER